jgi:hypothetical protein
MGANQDMGSTTGQVVAALEAYTTRFIEGSGLQKYRDRGGREVAGGPLREACLGDRHPPRPPSRCHNTVSGRETTLCPYSTGTPFLQNLPVLDPLWASG